jgi:mersacidin/lichenicidin family type 2 lantibiotic
MKPVGKKGVPEMAKEKIIRAWKDPAFRSSLSEAERAALPANPAGTVELTDAGLEKVTGAGPVFTYLNYCQTLNCTFRCITYFLTCTCKIGV